MTTAFNAKNFFRSLVANLGTLVLIGLCAGCYLPRQGVQLVRDLRQARPVNTVLSETSDTTLRAFLLETQAVKRFAIDSLGLADNRNYTTYLETTRPCAAFVVSAARADTFAQHRWCYPIVGCVPYKGYFDSTDARAEAHRLERKGLDTYEWRAGAFSTLGFFTDPLVSYMRGYDLYTLASLIIHEQTHATVYLKGQAQFNEELAEFVGREGALRYLQATRGDSANAYRSALERLATQEIINTWIAKLHARLDTAYSQRVGRETVLERKAMIIAEEKLALDSLCTARSVRGCRGVLSRDINNAWILLQKTYRDDLSLYERILLAHNGDLKQAIVTFLTARDSPKSPREHLAKLLSESAKTSER